MGMPATEDAPRNARGSFCFADGGWGLIGKMTAASAHGTVFLSIPVYDTICSAMATQIILLILVGGTPVDGGILNPWKRPSLCDMNGHGTASQMNEAIHSTIHCIRVASVRP